MSGTQILGGQVKEQGQANTGGQPMETGRETVLFNQEERLGTGKTANVLVLDTSASMNDAVGREDPRKKIDGVKEAASTFVVNVPSESFLAVVVFNSTAEVIRPMGAVGEQKLDIIRKLQEMKAQGQTAMEHALVLAEQELANVLPNYTKRVYLLTDGLPDPGTDPLSVAERLKKQQGAQANCVGFGEGQALDEQLLRSVASRSSSGEPLYYHFKDCARLTGFLKRQSKVITQ